MPMDQSFTKFLFCLLHFHLVDDSIINIISSLFLCSVLFILSKIVQTKIIFTNHYRHHGVYWLLCHARSHCHIFVQKSDKQR